jgi:hypothetical protein
MKKTLPILFLLLLLSFTSQAQTATNFNTKDCQGKTHDLFAELDAGKVIVMAWVMPCLSCLTPSLTAYKVVESYQANNPGRVLFYLADDDGGNTCTEIGSWANKYKIYENSFSARFSDQSIKMTDYGVEGMPKIVVMAGQNHKVYLNANDELNSSDLQKAINDALAVTSVNENKSGLEEIKIYPNPAKELLQISIKSNNATQLKFYITDILGRYISSEFNENVIPGKNIISKDLAAYKPGLYLIKILNMETQVYFSSIIMIK